MKKICIFFIACLFSCLGIMSNSIHAEENKFYYTSNIEHLFTHCLIAYPEIAFKNNNSMKKYLSTDCITAKEFLNILEELHSNSYALVSLNDCFETNSQGVTVKKKVKVPIGKKPLVLSFDDVNYDQKKAGKGMVDKIIVDTYGNLASQTQINGNLDVRHDNEFIPILENFIKLNPDFSIDGAKGTLNLTGYDGILGYRTSHHNKINRQQDINSAKKVVSKLKENGWTFACHSYGHYHMNKLSLEKFENELKLWNEEVVPLIGHTSVYVYPYGEWNVFENGEISQKHQLLINYGFKLFCGVGMKTYYSYLPNKNNYKVLFMDRKCVDGRTLASNNKELYPFFNPLNVLDTSRN